MPIGENWFAYLRSRFREPHESQIDPYAAPPRSGTSLGRGVDPA